MPIAANTPAKILSVELRIAITAAETLARNAVDFLTANNTDAETIVRCIEVEFHKAGQRHLRYLGALQSFIKPSGP